MTLCDALIEARSLITDKSNWTIGSYARTDKGTPAYIMSDEACKFCSLGALMRVTIKQSAEGTHMYVKAVEKLNASALKCFHLKKIDLVNDFIGHEAVIQVYDDAIEGCREPA